MGLNTLQRVGATRLIETSRGAWRPGWSSRCSRVAIRLDPKDAYAYANRAACWRARKDYVKALADDDEAIRRDPALAEAFNNRGLLWNDQGQYKKALADFDEAIRLRPSFARAFNNRGMAWLGLRDYKNALADWQHSGELDPRSSTAISKQAWIFATCVDPTYRDGVKAIAAATKACELTNWNNPTMLSVLAAAHAEAGNFDSAVNWQTKANSFTNTPAAKSIGESRLKLYRARKPYRG